MSATIGRFVGGGAVVLRATQSRFRALVMHRVHVVAQYVNAFIQGVTPL
jgi:hypothetical protein